MKKLLGVIVTVVLLGLSALPASATTLTDSFDRPDGAIGAPWSTANSTWGVSSNQAKVLTNQYVNTVGYAVQTLGSTNLTVSASVTLSPTFQRANGGLTILYVNPANNIFCKTEVTAGNPNGLMSIGRRRAGVTSSLLAKITNAGFVNGGTYTVTCARTGNVISMTVGALAISYTLTGADIAAFGSGTKVGLRAHLAADEDDKLTTYDNFSAVA